MIPEPEIELVSREDYAKVYIEEKERWRKEKEYQLRVKLWRDGDTAMKGFFHDVAEAELEKPARYSLKAGERYKILKDANGKCALCGASAADGATLHIDHIKPFSLHPELDSDVSNLQVLCDACNLGKSNKCDIDWR